jgi:protein-S-isoprenylcysteine O-methyltransferase Ste14
MFLSNVDFLFFVLLVFFFFIYLMKIIRVAGQDEKSSSFVSFKIVRLSEFIVWILFLISLSSHYFFRYYSEVLYIRLPDNVGWIGILVMSFFLFLYIWTYWSLGDNWHHETRVKKEHNLVKSGPYKWVRHPIYSGIFLFGVSVFLITGNVLSWLLVFLFFLLKVFRARVEEEILGEKFGDVYYEYVKETGMFFPGFFRKASRIHDK